MAIVLHHFEVVASFTETSGKSVDRTYVAGPSITTIAELAAAWALALPLINAMTDSVISSYAYKQIFVEDALVLPASAENNNQGIMTGKITGDPLDSGTVTIPAITPGVMVSPSGKGYDVIDTGDASVNAFIELFDPNAIPTAGPWTISDGESWVTATVSGVRRNTRSTNS